MAVEQNSLKRFGLSLGELKVSNSTAGVVGCVCYYRLKRVRKMQNDIFTHKS
jgi:hypothetical protein